MQKCLNFNVYTCLAELVDFDADIVYDDVDCFIIEGATSQLITSPITNTSKEEHFS